MVCSALCAFSITVICLIGKCYCCQANGGIVPLLLSYMQYLGKGMIKIIPIILGVIGSIGAAGFGQVDFTPLKEAAWFGLHSI